MMTLIGLLLKDVRLGLIAVLFFISSYLWREIGRLQGELKKVEIYLDKKKLDKEDFELYSGTHNEVHKGILEHLKTAIELLKERIR
ncbi:hypothetical protein [Ilyobacter polytropus]|uniref:Uncharacterized protein n=1 Tax=Ilyobacter polytropus (strain ATCC 51220 / DSM 2926 / LMG 16218 / CuHBu1) TaxID=572544 RepID=E3H9A0_ILYPC|nr:hypothetical protein [Ilyobacter polytropus]ADO82799.1 hypothetical protein Ilyop_1018 [Ilyobacter polytropus DSM 2926]